MNNTEEDLLLHLDSENLDSVSIIDEDELLGSVESKSLDELLNEDKSLQKSEKTSEPKTDTNALLKVNDCEQVEIENSKGHNDSCDNKIEFDELDYDEDDDEYNENRERISKFASERRENENSKYKEEKEIETSSYKNSYGSRKEQSHGKVPQNPQPIAVRLKLNDEPEKIFLPRITSSFYPPNYSSSMPNSLASVPSNHGHAGFGNNYLPSSTTTFYNPNNQGSSKVPPLLNEWDQAVALFLHETKKPARNRMKRKSSPRSSHSRSDSNSRSRSRSRNRSRSRSKSRSDRRKDDRRKRTHEPAKRSGKRQNSDKADHTRSDKRRKELKNTTSESAEALGLSKDYMDKMEDQQRKRDEVLRRKAERRHGLQSNDNKQNKKDETLSASEASSSSQTTERSRKAYLVVKVIGVEKLSTALKRVEKISTEIGPVKKVWQPNADTVAIIFEGHDKAKSFLIKYNNKILSGLKISVVLEKQYLILSEL